MRTTSVFLALLAAHSISAIDVPANLRSFYNNVKSNGCQGPNKILSGFYDTTDSGPDWSYCQNPKNGTNGTNGTSAIYLRGQNAFANMDIDCDGSQKKPGGGSYGTGGDTQSETRWKDQVSKYSNGKVDDLNAHIHPYVVFGNEGKYHPTFDPRKYGVEPLSVMAVVCGDQLVYGVWGDTNGDDDPVPLVGEASLALAQACYPKGITCDNGHDQTDVLYIAFTGDDAVPGSKADWAATSFNDFEDSIADLGNSLVQNL